NAANRKVDEWLVVTNRDDGRVFAHAAGGDPQPPNQPNAVTSINPFLRWTQDVTAKGGQPETFMGPPILMTGGTPQTTTFQVRDGKVFVGNTDAASGRPDHEFGYDDVVVCGGVSGRIFGID